MSEENNNSNNNNNNHTKAPLKPFASRKPKTNQNTIEEENNPKLNKIEDIY
jgi:hypothetical protein